MTKPLILYPAIDLKDGACVRLIKGDMDQATVFNTDPAAQAMEFAGQGFSWLHLVDLNGAFEGVPVNAAPVDEILKAIDLPIQLGGGIRDMATAENWIEKGITRIILGTAAVSDPVFVKEAARAFPGQVALGLDAKDGKVAVEGWAEASQLSVIDVARQFEDDGIAAIIYTDISRDGILTGLNIEATIVLAESLEIPVIASGGLASLEDIKALISANCKGLNGAISGRALYDGRIDPAVALALIKEAANA
jgi:phosphoribosylformimino-5-aminoimidazole carboxamide ribotide isomerase